MDLMKTVTGRFRIAGIWEGVSLLLLIFIAMPLKYFADISSAVAVMGMIHGILFPLYLIALVHLAVVKKWKITRWLMGGVAVFCHLELLYLNLIFEREIGINM